MKKILLPVLAMVAVASCSQNDESSFTMNDREVRISSSIATRMSNDTWAENDAIGVYMVAADGDFAAATDGNVKYTTPDETGSFTSETPFYFPATGKVDLLAYYPYDATTVVTDYAVNVADQTAPAKIDLMKAAANDVGVSLSAVGMTFDHKLARIVLNISAGDGMTAADLKGLTVKLSGTSTTADYDLTTDVVDNHGDVADITLQTTTDSESGVVTSAEAIVIPQTLSGAKLIVETKDDSENTINTYEAAIATTSFAVGKVYTYKMVIKGAEVKISSSNINAWTPDEDTSDDNLNAELLPPPVDYSDIATVNELLGRSDSDLRLSNCYIVDPAVESAYVIPVGDRINTFWSDDYGNELETGLQIGEDWTTNGTYTIEPLWNDFELDSYDGQITFSKVVGTDDPYAIKIEFADGFDKKGNMVVAVKKGDTIVWSWHIWITNYNPYDNDDENGTTYTINSDTEGTMLTWMDRNIGARSTAYSESEEGNLYYQWGRKDPLRAIDDGSDAVDASAARTIADVVKSPDKFYKGSADTNYDWCGGSGDDNWEPCRDHHWRDAKLPSVQAASGDKYGSTKSIYDPSPLGFMVPGSTSTTEWSSPFEFMNSSNSWNESDSNKGRTYNSDTTPIFFPAVGSGSSRGDFGYVGSSGFCWSATPSSATIGYNLAFLSTDVYTSSINYRAGGFPVRPIQEF